MALNHPVDLEAWQRWDAGRRRLRGALALVRGRGATQPAPVFLATRGEQPEVAVVLESRAASSRSAFLAPLGHLAAAAVYAPFDPSDLLPGEGWQTREVPSLNLGAQVPRARTVVAAGNYLPLSAEAYGEAVRAGLRFVVVQHGLLTPYAPPLPTGAHLLAWSAADAEFWRSGRDDVTTEVVGSQLLWAAAAAPQATLESTRPVFLGQLHGAELPRLGMTRAAVVFCRMTQASYRPHPSERDLVSRLQHRVFERAGIDVDRSATPLVDMGRPVVAAYSTGLLESAARGLPAWAFYPSPPAWLREFWERYGLSVWGADPTPQPPRPSTEPARAVAQRLA